MFATSTCGVDRQETYIAPCGGEGSARPCTYTCDDSNPDTSHRPGNIALPYSSADVDQTWWQSSLGHEMVTLEINLEALFYFTHFIMTFKSPRPLSLLVEVSQDFGTTFKPYQYFADNCFTRFGLDTRDRPSDIADVICTSSYLEERNSREVGVFIGVSVGVSMAVLVGVSMGMSVGMSMGVLLGVSMGMSVCQWVCQWVC